MTEILKWNITIAAIFHLLCFEWTLQGSCYILESFLTALQLFFKYCKISMEYCRNIPLILRCYVGLYSFEIHYEFVNKY